MKRFLLISILGSGLGAAAQEPLPLKKLKMPLTEVYQLRADTSGDRIRDLNPVILQRGLLPQATFSHETSRGKIYNLPVDNMPCLVPDMKQVSRMPGTFPTPQSRMPNAMPKQRLIPPDKKDEKN